MTAQFSDVVIYQERPFYLAGINGSGLFDPVDYGINPIAWCTACYRGYHCVYEVIESFLCLVKINIGLDDATFIQGMAPSIFGKLPRRYIEEGYEQRIWPMKPRYVRWESSDLIIDDIREPIPFTGGLLLGYGFISELYTHMGFHPAYKFRTVYELIFDTGHITEVHNHSLAMASCREELTKGGASSISLEEWIEKCFSREYKIGDL